MRQAEQVGQEHTYKAIVAPSRTYAPNLVSKTPPSVVEYCCLQFTDYNSEDILETQKKIFSHVLLYHQVEIKYNKKKNCFFVYKLSKK